jgi:hypothetical protein
MGGRRMCESTTYGIQSPFCVRPTAGNEQQGGNRVAADHGAQPVLAQIQSRRADQHDRYGQAAKYQQRRAPPAR